MEEKDLMTISADIQSNLKEEGQAIEDYSLFLDKVAKSDISEKDKEKIFNVVEEIISDELNHQLKLHMLYTEITGIETNKN